MKKLMGITAQGARAVMRVYTRACCDKNRTQEGPKINRGLERYQELRQLSMNDFTTAMSGMISFFFLNVSKLSYANTESQRENYLVTSSI